MLNTKKFYVNKKYPYYSSVKGRSYRKVGGKIRYQKPRKVQGISYLPLSGRQSMTGVPTTMNLQMKTFDNKAIPIGAGTTHNEFALKLNSTFDPTGDVGVVQPVGRDQIATLYGSYIVSSGNVKITFSNTTAAPVYFMCYTASGAAVAAGINNYCAQPGAKYRLCAKAGDGGTTVSLSRSFRISQIVGPLDRSSHGASAGADPATLAYLYISIYSSDATNVTGNLGVEIVQNTSWYDKVTNVHA